MKSFRIWDVINKKFADISAYIDNNYNLFVADLHENNISGQQSIKFNDQYIFAGYYTGVKDTSKNEIEICDGDILDGDIGRHIVRFGEFDNGKDYADNDTGIGFYLELERDGSCNYSLNSRLVNIYNLIVIGNIYKKVK